MRVSRRCSSVARVAAQPADQDVRRRGSGAAAALAVVDPALESIEHGGERGVVLGAAVPHARDVVDGQQVAPAALLGLAALSLSLGVTYWLVRDKEEGRRGKKGERTPFSSGPA